MEKGPLKIKGEEGTGEGSPIKRPLSPIKRPLSRAKTSLMQQECFLLVGVNVKLTG